MSFTLLLRAPLFTSWTEQYVRLTLPGVKPGTPLALSIAGAPVPFQYSGAREGHAAEVWLRLGFAQGEEKRLEFTPAAASATDLARSVLSWRRTAVIGAPGRELRLPLPAGADGQVRGPFAGFAGFPMASTIRCPALLERATLTRTADGPLFTDYEVEYAFAERRAYTLSLRCYKLDPYVEVAERFSLRMGAEMVWTLNPERRFDSILSRDSFEGESQPTVEPLGAEHPRDVLCRLQMPVLSEYFIPNNRGWFAFFDSRDTGRGMLGVLGLYGARWQQPVENMPELLDRGATVEWHASLASGARHWLLYTGPVETAYTPERRLVFHRLHAEFNALRLDEHLDLTGEALYDAGCRGRPGFFGPGDCHAAARARAAALPPLRRFLAGGDVWSRANGGGHLCILRALLEPTPPNHAAVHAYLLARFEKWVRQFQGWRTGENDYMKNVIGFSRWLRGMLLGYELLRRDGVLTPAEERRLNAYFVFAARRITDEGRWPHSRTGLHPDHPESSRDLYAYGGEHRPDRLYWTNSLPNFQSDPMCALAQLAALFPEHPDAPAWQRRALEDIEHQLDAYCGRSGAWEESINYALYTFSYFVITFKTLKAYAGIDYFQDERVRRYAAWLVRFLGPCDRRWDKYTWPGIGNARCPTGGGEYLLCFAAELPAGDPLRADLVAVYQKLEPNCAPSEHYPLVLAALAPLPADPQPLRPLASEVMDEVGVALRHGHPGPRESYLFQKIGFAKDHYEADETAFNWYAKGTPLCMDYGTYTGDVGIGAAHNLVDIPDLDPLRRGYLAGHVLSPAADYTHCEMPVVLKLLWGRVRTFAEVDGKDGIIDRRQTPYFYIGDRNPVGPKTWKVRLLLFVKPDYVALFDRVYGDVPHRFCLHVTGDELRRDGARLSARGRFDLDLHALVQHPAEFEVETGETVPKLGTPDDPDAGRPHRQGWFRLYNHTDGIYRTLLFAAERGRDVRLEAAGAHGVRVVTPDYTDYVFLHDDTVQADLGDGVAFCGRAAWIRRAADGTVRTLMADGDRLTAFGFAFAGRGPWGYNLEDGNGLVLLGGPPREIRVRPAT